MPTETPEEARGRRQAYAGDRMRADDEWDDCVFTAECVVQAMEAEAPITARQERERITAIFRKCGESLIENAKSLAECDGEGYEARTRMHAGMAVLGVAQILELETRSEQWHEQADALMRDIKAAIGEEKWAEIEKEAADHIGVDPTSGEGESDAG